MTEIKNFKNDMEFITNFLVDLETELCDEFDLDVFTDKDEETGKNAVLIGFYPIESDLCIMELNLNTACDFVMRHKTNYSLVLDSTVKSARQALENYNFESNEDDENDSLDDSDADIFTDFDEKRLKDLVLVVTQIENSNADAKQKCFWTQIEDMCFFFAYEENGSLKVITKESVLKSPYHPDKRIKELIQIALKNMALKYPCEIRNAKSVDDEGEERVFNEAESEYLQLNKSYFVAGANSPSGCLAVFYPNVLKKCAEKIGGNFYILPISRNLVHIIPDEGYDPLWKCALISNNKNMEDDVVSNTVFHYSVKDDALETDEVFVSRTAPNILH